MPVVPLPEFGDLFDDFPATDLPRIPVPASQTTQDESDMGSGSPTTPKHKTAIQNEDFQE